MKIIEYKGFTLVRHGEGPWQIRGIKLTFAILQDAKDYIDHYIG